MKSVFDKHEEEHQLSSEKTNSEKDQLSHNSFVDNRPEAVQMRAQQDLLNNSPQVKQLQAFQKMANASPQVKQLQAFQEKINSDFSDAPLQQKENKTGLPDQLKTGIENLSGYAMDDVKVHYNSTKPVQLNAHAYAQGSEIHLASGQEKHLPHEAWHVVQQKQGRVQPTVQMKGINVNDDDGLEREATEMGAAAMRNQTGNHPTKNSTSNSQAQNIQLKATNTTHSNVIQLFSNKRDLIINGIRIPGYLLLTWFQHVTRETLPHFFAGTRAYDELVVAQGQQATNTNGGPANWLHAMAQIGKRNNLAASDPAHYPTHDGSDRGLIGSVAIGAQQFNVERGLWVKPQGQERASRYTDLAAHLHSEQGGADEAAGHARNIRKIISGDSADTHLHEQEAALAMFGAEHIRNPKTYGTSLMLLDLIENKATYGRRGKSLTWDKVLASHKHGAETDEEFARRKIGDGPAPEPAANPQAGGKKKKKKGPPPPKTREMIATETDPRWREKLAMLRMSGAIQPEAQENRNDRSIIKRAMDRRRFAEYWAGKFPMSPKFSETLGRQGIGVPNMDHLNAWVAGGRRGPKPKVMLNVVHEKEISIIIRWLEGLLSEKIKKSIPNILAAQRLIKAIFKLRLMTTQKVDLQFIRMEERRPLTYHGPNTRPLPRIAPQVDPLVARFHQEANDLGPHVAKWRLADRMIQRSGGNRAVLREGLELQTTADLEHLQNNYRTELALMTGADEDVDDDIKRIVIAIIDEILLERRDAEHPLHHHPRYIQ